MTTKEHRFEGDHAVLAVFIKMIGAVSGVEIKGAKKMAYTSINGNMYALISKSNVIGLRLAKDDRDKFLEKYQSTLFEGVPGHFMKEYVAMPQSLHQNTRAMRSWFRKSHAYAKALKPKKTTR